MPLPEAPSARDKFTALDVPLRLFKTIANQLQETTFSTSGGVIVRLPVSPPRVEAERLAARPHAKGHSCRQRRLPSIASRANGSTSRNAGSPTTNELYRSGRWKHYYTEDALAERMRDVIKAVTFVDQARFLPARRQQTTFAPPHEMGRRSRRGGRRRVPCGQARGRRRISSSAKPCWRRIADPATRSAAAAIQPRKDAPAFRTLGKRYPIELSGRGVGRGHHVRPP